MRRRRGKPFQTIGNLVLKNIAETRDAIEHRAAI
jgi:hypothetical protein